MDIPLHILHGFISSERPSVAWGRRLAAWGGFLAILLGFVLLQMKMVITGGNWTSILILISLILEYGLIWLWNKLF